MVRGDGLDGGDAGLGQQRLGLVGVVAVNRGGLLVRGVLLLHEARGRSGQRPHARGADLLVVKGVHDGLTRLDVGECALVVEHDEHEAEPLVRGDHDRIRHRAEVRRRHGVDGLNRAGGDRVGARGVVGQDLPRHLLGERRVGTVVVVIALEDNGLRRSAVVRHLVRTGSDRVHVEGLGVGLDHRLGNDLDGAEPLGDQGVGMLGLDGDRGVVLGRHRLQEGEELAVERIVRRVENALEGEDDVFDGHVAAVGELGAVAQGDLVSRVVDLHGQVLAESRVCLAADRVELGEPLQGVPVGGNGQTRCRGHRVIAARPQLVGDARGDGAVGVGALGAGGSRAAGGAAACGQSCGETGSHPHGGRKADEVTAGSPRS